MSLDRAALWRRQAAQRVVESTPEPCTDCGAEVIKCGACGDLIKVYEVLDEFHRAWCEDCGAVTDEPCCPRGVAG